MSARKQIVLPLTVRVRASILIHPRCSLARPAVFARAVLVGRCDLISEQFRLAVFAAEGELFAVSLSEVHALLLPFFGGYLSSCRELQQQCEVLAGTSTAAFPLSSKTASRSEKATCSRQRWLLAPAALRAPLVAVGPQAVPPADGAAAAGGDAAEHAAKKAKRNDGRNARCVHFRLAKLPPALLSVLPGLLPTKTGKRL